MAINIWRSLYWLTEESERKWQKVKSRAAENYASGWSQRNENETWAGACVTHFCASDRKRRQPEIELSSLSGASQTQFRGSATQGFDRSAERKILIRVQVFILLYTSFIVGGFCL